MKVEWGRRCGSKEDVALAERGVGQAVGDARLGRRHSKKDEDGGDGKFQNCQQQQQQQQHQRTKQR